jgi:hypothetical protein
MFFSFCGYSAEKKNVYLFFKKKPLFHPLAFVLWAIAFLNKKV